MEIQTIFDTVGDYVSNLTKSVLEWLSTAGFVTSEITAKVISILIVAIASYMVLHFVDATKKSIRIIIIILSVFLALSLIVSFIN